MYRIVIVQSKFQFYHPLLLIYYVYSLVFIILYKISLIFIFSFVLWKKDVNDHIFIPDYFLCLMKTSNF